MFDTDYRLVGGIAIIYHQYFSFLTLLMFNSIDFSLTQALGFAPTLPLHRKSCRRACPIPLCSRVRPDVRDRQTDRQTDRHQTDVRQKHRLMPPSYGGGGIIRSSANADKPRVAFRGQSRSPNMVPFHVLGIVSY